MKALSQFEVTTMLLRKTAKELGLTQSERLVLIQMSECFPCIRKSHKTFAELIGCSTKTIQRSIHTLVDKGYLQVIRPYNREESAPAEYALDVKALDLENKPSNTAFSDVALTYALDQTPHHRVYKFNVWWVDEDAADYCKQHSLRNLWLPKNSQH